MAENVVCGNCHAEIVGESADVLPPVRKPCPTCGSTARIVSAVGHMTGTSTMIGVGRAVRYPERLLEVAQRLFDDRQYSIAVVVAHIACEIAAGHALSAAYAAKGIGYLEDAIDDLLNGYNLANKKNRKLFTALTGKFIAAEPFWQNFIESSERRNKAVHGSFIATKAEAEESLKATSAVVTYLS